MTVSIGVVFGSMERETRDILSYLITYQNTLQRSFEFVSFLALQIIPF
jgi:hypothetical protein